MRVKMTTREKQKEDSTKRNARQSDYLGLVRFKSITLYLIPQNECENLICFIFLRSSVLSVSRVLLLSLELLNVYAFNP
jgi:hypothetical protein